MVIPPVVLWMVAKSYKAAKGWLKPFISGINGYSVGLPSGKHTKNYGKIHHFQWENPLFLWPFSIANCNKLPEGTSNVGFPSV